MKPILQILQLVVLLSTLNLAAFSQEWRQLFNGKDLTGWEQVGPGKFVLEDGSLKTTGGMGMLLFNGQKFENSIIRVVYKVRDNDANSGVFIRIPEKPKDSWHAVNTGYEVQIDGGLRYFHDDYHTTGCLYSLTKARAYPQKAPGEWNIMEITLDGLRTSVVVNDKKVTDYYEGDDVPLEKRWFEPDRGRRPQSGYIGLQNHDPESIVYFKEVSVKSLIK
jgi:hypothetical protein